MKTRHFRVGHLSGTGIALILAALACNAPLGPATPTPVGEMPTFFIDPALLTISPEGTEGPTETPTLDVTATPTVGCTYWGAYSDDVTIPDGTQIPAGSTFVKTWELWNNGCLDWPAGTELIMVRGDPMGDVDTADVPPTPANGLVEVSVTLTAPLTPGEYTSYWRLRAPDGEIFGEEVYVEIRVIPASTPTPTLTATPTPSYQAFVGTWINQDPEGRISRVEITAAVDVITVHLWQDCAPTDCDLGAGMTTAVDAMDSVLAVTVTRTSATESMLLAILLDGRLEIVGSVDSGGTVTRYIAYFTRQQ